MSAKVKTKVQDKSKTDVREKSKSAVQAKSKVKGAASNQPGEKIRVVNRISPPRSLTNGNDRKPARGARLVPQYAYMKAPGLSHDFQVGDRVEVFCDHEKNKERIRGWIAGIVVQVDNKMVAVQFRSNVFLTDGWMVPDRILWYPLASEHIRPVAGKKSGKREKAIPDY
jgi:hypothetical protein